LTTKKRKAQQDFYNAKSSKPDENSNHQKKISRKTATPLQTIHNKERPIKSELRH
jgi:hypothetical protein